ncbi:hypothetical protein CHH83_01755 [Bacillus sp. 7586-K]|nr:hypothetical protein CHH83_01755 [Bacillus sp. 7586-K]
MKIFTEKQYQKLLDEFARKLDEANREGFESGYNKGLHEGLTTDKKGILLNSNGIYTFDDNVSKCVIK